MGEIKSRRFEGGKHVQTGSYTERRPALLGDDICCPGPVDGVSNRHTRPYIPKDNEQAPSVPLLSDRDGDEPPAP
jgi:hypothetical protein